jgi:hypothetical protein
MGFFSATYFGGGGSASTDPPAVVTDGTILTPIVIGDDYLSANDRAFVFDKLLPDNVTGASKCYFSGRHRYRCNESWLVEGAVSFPTAGYVRLTFELPGSATEGLVDGEYMYSVMIVDDSGKKITPEASIDRPVDLIYGQGALSACPC